MQEAAKLYDPVKPAGLWGDDDWASFKNDGFKPKNPISEDQVFKDADIPF